MIQAFLIYIEHILTHGLERALIFIPSERRVLGPLAHLRRSRGARISTPPPTWTYGFGLQAATAGAAGF